MSVPEVKMIEEIERLIDSHIDETNYAIEHICRDLGLSRSLLFRVVKEQTGLSPSRFIRQYRLLKAKELLENTNLRIVEIAAQVGFDSQQTFSKFFNQEFGVSPTEYRKNKPKTIESIAFQEQEPIEESPQIQPPQRKAPKSIIPIQYKFLGFTLLALAGLVVAFYIWQHFKTEAPESEISIVVLPFKSNNNTEKLLLAEGLIEQIHISLTSIENLKVISKNSSMLFESSQKKISQIASQLQVANVEQNLR